MHVRLLLCLPVLAVAAFSSCNENKSQPARAAVAAAQRAAAPPKPPSDKLARLDFNRRAAERFVPLFWRSDANKNGALDPDELAFLWGYGNLNRDALIGKDGFTNGFAL